MDENICRRDDDGEKFDNRAAVEKQKYWKNEREHGSVLGSEYVPPLSTLPVDASRWEQPVTDEEAQIYCGNGIDCVKCHYCEEVLSKYSN